MLRLVHTAPRVLRAAGARNLSATAASADGGSFIRALFQGQLDTSQLIPYPAHLDEEVSETLTMLVDTTARFMAEENDAGANDAAAGVTEEVANQLKEMGMFGLQAPEEYGGLELNNTAYGRMVEVVGGGGAAGAQGVGGAGDLGLGIYMGAHQSIGYKGIILEGTPEQKEKYLPKLASGEHEAAFVLTEPSAGSDANSIRSRAVLSDDGKHWVLSGSKIYISNGPTAEIFTVFAQTPCTDAKTGEPKDKVTAFIVERSFGGVTNGPPEKKLGIKCSQTSELYFDNCHIPVENVLGEVGKGFHVAMAILNNGRFGMGCALTGVMKQTIATCVDQANVREQFGSKLSEFQLIKDRLARMSMTCYAAESIGYAVAGAMDAGATDYQLEAAASKVFASDGAWNVQDSAIQLFGGGGFMEGTLSRTLRDLRIFRIFEGENNILSLFIALTASQDAGKQLGKVAKNPLANIGAISESMKRRAGMGGASFEGAHAALAPSAALIEAQARSFSVAVERLLIQHKKGILQEQLAMKRVAACAIDLYAMACCVARASRAQEINAPSAAHEALLANTFCADAAHRVEAELATLANPPADADILRVADDMLSTGHYVPQHPLGF